LGHKKNDIKNSISNCFSCGEYLENIEDKFVHRINLSKNISKNNVVILCQECKEMFKNRDENKLFDNIVSRHTLNKYFQNHDNNYKISILKNLQLQKDKFKNEQ